MLRSLRFLAPAASLAILVPLPAIAGVVPTVASASLDFESEIRISLMGGGTVTQVNFPSEVITESVMGDATATTSFSRSIEGDISSCASAQFCTVQIAVSADASANDGEAIAAVDVPSPEFRIFVEVPTQFVITAPVLSASTSSNTGDGGAPAATTATEFAEFNLSGSMFDETFELAAGSAVTFDLLSGIYFLTGGDVSVMATARQTKVVDASEPATLALLGFALLGLSVTARRRA